MQAVVYQPLQHETVWWEPFPTPCDMHRGLDPGLYMVVLMRVSGVIQVDSESLTS